MLSGSFASSYYGLPRSSQDVDLVISATRAQLKTFLENFTSSHYYFDVDAALTALQRESMFNLIDLTSGWKIDMIIRRSRAFSQEEFRRRQRIAVQGIHLWIASPEDVVISKLEWSKLAQSRRQIEDVSAILSLREASLDIPYLEKWIEELDLKQEWASALSGAT